MSEKGLSDFFSVVGPFLDERQRRLVAGATPQLLGRGGSTAVARAGKMSRTTVITGTKEIADGKTARENGCDALAEDAERTSTSSRSC